MDDSESEMIRCKMEQRNDANALPLINRADPLSSAIVGLPVLHKRVYPKHEEDDKDVSWLSELSITPS